MSANVGESYNEQILQATIDGEPYVNENPYPSRIEVLLMELKESIEQGGGAVIDATVNGTSENAVQNKAIYNYVNSSVATNTANFIGTFNSVDALEAYSGTVTNNDYAFVIDTDSDGNTVYNRYKYNGETETWSFEYALNNSSFTAAQWAAINSGLTSYDKTTINGLGAASTKGFDALPTSGNTNNAVSSDGVYQAMTGKLDKIAHMFVNEEREIVIGNRIANFLSVVNYGNVGLFLCIYYPDESSARIFPIYKSSGFDAVLSITANGNALKITPANSNVWYIADCGVV